MVEIKKVNFIFRKSKWSTLIEILIILFLFLTPLISLGRITSEPPKRGTIEVTETSTTLPERIIIGARPWMGHAPYVVAEEKGFFSDEGLDVKVVLFAKRYEMDFSLGKGKIHFCDCDMGDFIVDATLGYPITLAMENIWDLHSDYIIIKNKFKDLSQLKGKRITCEKDAYADYFFVVKALEKYGLTTKEVEIIDMTDEEALVAFIKGNVDAMFAAEPYASLAIKEGEGKVAVVRNEIDNDPIGLAVQNEILNKSPDTVVKVQKAYLRAVKWRELHKDEYYEIANRRLFHCDQTRENLIDLESKVKRLEPKEIKREMKDGGPLYRYCEEILDFYYDQGVIDSKPDPNSFINNELYLKAIGAYYGG
jgi:NitT/TauT family transport system substrate-binding protein